MVKKEIINHLKELHNDTYIDYRSSNKCNKMMFILEPNIYDELSLKWIRFDNVKYKILNREWLRKA